MNDPTPDDIANSVGATLIEFGASWCGHCHATRAAVDALRDRSPNIRYIAIEDGPGRPLGRSFRVKLWPTFVFLRNGQVTRRLVRPSEQKLIEAFAAESLPGSN